MLDERAAGQRKRTWEGAGKDAKLFHRVFGECDSVVETLTGGIGTSLGKVEGEARQATVQVLEINRVEGAYHYGGNAVVSTGVSLYHQCAGMANYAYLSVWEVNPLPRRRVLPPLPCLLAFLRSMVTPR